VPRSPRFGRWKACLGGVRLQRIGVHFWNGNINQISSIDLGRTLRKLLAAFRTFQHHFSPYGNRNQCTHTAALSPPSWNATHTVIDVHPRASTERIRGDNDLRFCTYTCRELPRVPICCHFATFYSFPGNKSVPELNDQPRYIGIFLTCGEISKFVSAFAVAESVSYSLHYTLQLCTYKYLGQRWRSVPGYLWGNSGSVTACNRKRDLKINKCPVEVFNCNCRVFIWQKDVKTKKELTMCYCDVPIEFFFQIELSWLHRNGKSEQDCELELI